MIKNANNEYEKAIKKGLIVPPSEETLPETVLNMYNLIAQMSVCIEHLQHEVDWLNAKLGK